MIPEKRRYNVGVVKIPHRDRDVVHRVLANDERGFRDVIGADTPDDDDDFPVGSECTYSLELTPPEVRDFEEASNLRYIEPDEIAYPATTPGPHYLSPNGIPSDRTLRYMGCDFPTFPDFHGRDVRMAVLDQGTTAIARQNLGINLVGRAIFGDVPDGGAEVHGDQTHGTLVAGNLIPAGGRLLDAMIVTKDGKSSSSLFAAGLRWACDNGAKVINYSFGSYSPSQVYVDALSYLNRFDAVLTSSAGNDSRNQISTPASYSTSYPDRVLSAVAFDERTNAKASFSNYSSNASGVAPGVLVLSVTQDGYAAEWSGTSAAAPMAGNLIGRIQTGGRVSSKQALALLLQHRRQTGQPTLLQGGGAFDLQRVVAPGTGVPGGPDPEQPPATTGRNALLTVI